MRSRLCVLGLALVTFASGAARGFAQQSTTNAPGEHTINAATIGDLELGFVVPSEYCGTFSDDDRLMGTYDLTTGQRWFQINTFSHALSDSANVTVLEHETAAALAPETQINSEQLYVRPDQNLLIIQRLGAFELTSGLRRLDFYGFASLSPDGEWMAAPNLGVYDVHDWTLVQALDGDDMVRFSPDGTRYAVGRHGVYDVQTGRREFAISGVIPAFSPDGRWLVVVGDGLYDVETGERVIVLENTPFASPRFSPDSRWVAVAGAVFDLTTGEKQFDLDIWNAAAFSPDSQRVVGADGVYDVETGERLFELSGARVSFSADGSLVATTDGSIYNVATGEQVRALPGSVTLSPAGSFLSVDLSPYCALYGLPDAAYPYRSGLVEPYSGVNVRQRPSTSGAIVASTRETLAVSAQTADGQWLRVFRGDLTGWVAAEAVRILELPEGVPVETP